MISGRFEALFNSKKRPGLTSDQEERLRILDNIYVGNNTDTVSNRYFEWRYLLECRIKNDSKPEARPEESNDLSDNPRSGTQFSKIAPLLKEHGLGMSVIAANKILGAAGLIVHVVRPSTLDKSKVRKFKALSAMGEHYGKNVKAHHPLETEIVYSRAGFGELVKKYLTSGQF